MAFLQALLSVAVVSLVSFAGVLTLTLREATLKRAVVVLVAFSAGALFGDVFIHLLPEAYEEGLTGALFSFSILAGILAFFILEKFLHWHHHHGVHEEGAESSRVHDHSPKPLGMVVLVADALHNIIDGVIIGASFLVSPALGLATTVAVFLHEIPQEMGDFGILIHSGWTRARALLWNFLSGISAVLGVIFVFLAAPFTERIVPFAVALTAGAFLYIAGTDLVPELHQAKGFWRSVVQIAALVAGFSLMFLLRFVEAA